MSYISAIYCSDIRRAKHIQNQKYINNRLGLLCNSQKMDGFMCKKGTTLSRPIPATHHTDSFPIVMA